VLGGSVTERFYSVCPSSAHPSSAVRMRGCVRVRAATVLREVHRAGTRNAIGPRASFVTGCGPALAEEVLLRYDLKICVGSAKVPPPCLRGQPGRVLRKRSSGAAGVWLLY